MLKITPFILVSIILFSVLPSTSASVIASVGPNGEEVNGDCYGISRVSFNGSYDQNSGMFSASVESCSDDAPKHINLEIKN
jgi:hypothetical protein